MIDVENIRTLPGHIYVNNLGMLELAHNSFTLFQSIANIFHRFQPRSFLQDFASIKANFEQYINGVYQMNQKTARARTSARRTRANGSVQNLFLTHDSQKTIHRATFDMAILVYICNRDAAHNLRLHNSID